MIIETLAQAGRPLTPTEINQTLQLPKPTIHRLCSTLIEQRFLVRDIDPKRLRPAKRLMTISSGLMASSRIQIACRAVIKAVSVEVGETCNLSVPEQEGMLYVDRVETHWPMRFQLPIGSTVPFHCTAAGKMFLSSLSNTELKKLLSAVELDSFARNTITKEDALKAELGVIRKRGFSRDNEEFIDNLVAVAVPVQDPNGRLFAALAFHGPTQRLSLEEAEAQIDVLTSAASQLSKIIFDDPE